MLKSEGKRAKLEAKERAKKTRKRPSVNVPVHVTPYGTRYVLPIDLLFSSEEMDKLIDEALAEHSKEPDRKK